MPKDEFDFEDPLELNGVAFLTEEDTTDVMCECFIEEFMRLGYNPKQILALFRDPNYLGMNLVLEKRGELFIRSAITDLFARWGRKVAWPEIVGQGSRLSASAPSPENPPCDVPGVGGNEVGLTVAPSTAAPPVALPDSVWADPRQAQELDASDTDPMGDAAPKLNL
jgi:hypothetical protein